ncbi:MAG: O-antigen ligase family protein [Acidobacteria bacterium]|nr:O-antigen ligase family protein [Acidobacteriota bacterium]
MSSAYDATTDYELNGELPDSLDGESLPQAKEKLPVYVIGVAVLTLFFVTQLLQLVPSVQGIPFAKIVVGMVVLIFVFSPHLLANRLRLKELPQIQYILCILALALATVPLSVWPSDSFNFIFQGYAKNIVFVYLLAQGLKTDRSARAICGALVLGCALIVLALLSGFGPEVSLNVSEERINVAGTYDVNDLALLFIVALPFAFFMLKDSTRWQRLLLFFAIALMVIGIIKSASRGGFVGLVVISLLLLIRSSKQARKYALVAILGGAMLFAVAAPAAYWARITTIFSLEKDYNFTDQRGRQKVWENGLKMIAAHPLNGVGINCFMIAHADFSGTNINISPHNSFLQIAAELGLPGLLLFVLIIGSSLIAARRVRRLTLKNQLAEEYWWLASALEVSFLGFIVSASFLTHAYSPIFCFLTGIAASLVARYQAATNQTSASQDETEIDYD